MLKLTWIMSRLLYYGNLKLALATVSGHTLPPGTAEVHKGDRQCREHVNPTLGHAAIEEEITLLEGISVSVANAIGIVVVGTPVESSNTFAVLEGLEALRR